MAARSHVDSSVNERRLRPIYDCLDNGNNKKAFQEAEKLLKKQKDFLCAKALKALALLRLGRQDEAAFALREVHLEGPIDDATLQAMTICYRELHKPELIADAYETAVKKDPQNEELLSHLFMSYVRIGDYKKQQQTAMALFKLKPKNPYYFWAVMSIVMQANNADEKLSKSMFLPLAERMTEKFVKDNKIEAEAEVQLYLMILERQHKYEQALTVLESDLKGKLTSYMDFLPRKRAELLIKLERWPEANAAYKNLILSNPDQWMYYVEYFKSLTHLVDSNWRPALNSDNIENSVDHTHEKDVDSTFDNNVDCTFEQAVDLISALVEEQESGNEARPLRGPYLAQIELLHRLLKRNDPLASKIGTTVGCLLSFYLKFGAKPSCFMDIAHVLSSTSLAEEEISDLLKKMENSLQLEISNEKVPLPENAKQMQRHLCYSQLCHYVGYEANWSQQQKLAYARELIERYNHGLQFGSQLLATELQPSDNYCLLAAHTLIDIWRKTGDERLIAQGMILLEQGLKGSPHNFQMKLLLIKLYNIIGAVGASLNIYESIDIKHIQQETLGYLITDNLISAGFFTSGNAILASCIRFFSGNYKDTVDYLISCYKFGSFIKIPEIVNFREKLNNSLHYRSVTAERMILDLILETKSHSDVERIISCMEIDPEHDKSPWNNLTDNRDVSIFRIWSAKDKAVFEEQVSKSFKEKVLWLQMRNLLMRILAAAFYLTKSPSYSNNIHGNDITNGDKRNMADILNELALALKDHIAAIDSDNLIQSIFPLQAPGPCRLLLYIQGGHANIVISLSKLLHCIYGLIDNSSTELTEADCDIKVIDSIIKYFQALVKRVQQLASTNKEMKTPTQTRELFEELTNSTETLSFSTLLVGFCHSLLKPARNSLMRKGKKKKENNTPVVIPETFILFTELAVQMEIVANSLMNVLHEFDVASLSFRLGIMSLRENETCLEGKQDTVRQLTEKIESSYQNSIKELKDVLQSKVKYLQSLKW